MNSIPILDLTRQYQQIKDQVNQAVLDVMASGGFILGKNVKGLEEELAKFLGVKHVIGCASGTDALFLALKALKIGAGDEVITTPFTFIATTESIVRTGAKPVLCDIDPDTYNMDVSAIEALITPNTKAIMPVHLYGQPVDMDALMALAKKHNLAVVEDCAQSIGATWDGTQTGNIGSLGCFSFFPSKNLGAFGDGGMVTTNDDALAERVRMLRVHGSRQRYYHEEPGINSRLDEMQAAILRVKLPHLASWNEARRTVAKRYKELLAPFADEIQTPVIHEKAVPVFHQYTIRFKKANASTRDAIQKRLAEAGISTMIYYPVPCYAQQTHAELGYNAADYPVSEKAIEQVLSLPMFPELTAEEQQTVVSELEKAMKAVLVPA